jgi:hypothetical protein
MDQFLLELKKLPRPQPILLGAVIAFLGMVLYAYREVIDYYWLPRWGDENGYYSYAYLVPPLALVMIWMRRERLLRLEARPSWWGVPLFLLAMGIHALGHWGYSSWVSSMGFPLLLIAGQPAAVGHENHGRAALPPAVPVPDDADALRRVRRNHQSHQGLVYRSGNRDA